MASPKALMLDVDGVLVRGRPDDGRPWSADLQADLGVNAKELHRAFFSLHWDDIVLGRVALTDRLVPVLAAIAPQVTAEQLIDYWFRQDAGIDLNLLAEVDDLRRRGTPVHLVTNQDHRRAAYLMDHLNLSRHVDGIHYSAALGLRKPDPAFFRCVATRVHRPSHHLVLVDDALDNVRGAKAAGWSAIHWDGQGSLVGRLEALQAT